jgi:hypothetical protein
MQLLLQWKSSITQPEHVIVALGIQHAMRMRHVVIRDLPCCTILFHIITLTARFLEKKRLNTKCVFRFSLQFLSETFFILKRTERHMIKTYTGLHVKYPIFLKDFNET